MNPNTAEIGLSVRLPGQTEWKHLNVVIDCHVPMFRDAFRPTDRIMKFVPFISNPTQEARVLAARKEVAKWMREHFEVKLAELLGSDDTKNGCTAKEWEEMHGLGSKTPH